LQAPVVFKHKLCQNLGNPSTEKFSIYFRRLLFAAPFKKKFKSLSLSQVEIYSGVQKKIAASYMRVFNHYLLNTATDFCQ